MVILMNTEDMAERQIDDGVDVDLISAAGDNVKRVVHGLRAVAYNVPRGSLPAIIRSAIRCCRFGITRSEAKCLQPSRSACRET